jgi:peptidoglycan/LPS O-acetylase OafA/YrhL
MTQKLHLWFSIIFIALGYVLFGTTAHPTDTVNIHDNNSLVGFFDIEHQQQSERVFRWAKPDAQIIVPYRLVGLVMIDYVATTAQQPTTLTLTSNQHAIARHVVQPGQFRMYHILGNIPWQSANSNTQITLNSDHVVHANKRTLTVAISQFRIHAHTPFVTPNITLWPVVALVLLTIVSSYVWKQTPRTIILLYTGHSIGLLLIWWFMGLSHWVLPWYIVGVAIYAVIPWIDNRFHLATSLLNALVSLLNASWRYHLLILVSLVLVYLGIMWLIMTQLLPIKIQMLQFWGTLIIICMLGISLTRFIQRYRTTHGATTHHYRRDIDGIRTIAVLSVVVYHFFPDVLPGGFIGVDIFFVISGFLITQNILTQHALQRFSMRDFYERRIRRILPALSVVLIATSVIAWISLYLSEFRDLGSNVIASVGFFNNIHLYYSSLNYFADFAVRQPLLHLWSLGIEEQFYIFWPLLISMLVRHPRWQAMILASIVMMSFTINIIDIQFHPEATFYLLPSRLWQLACGGILAHVIYGQNTNTLPRSLANILAITGLAIIAVCVGIYNEKLNYPGWYALFPTMAAVLLIAAGSHAWSNRTILAHPIIVWVGLISYPLYLWHWPLLSFATFLAEFWLTPIIKVGILVLSIILAAGTYYFIEQPIRFGRYKNLSAWNILAVFVSIGGLGWLMQSKLVPVLAKIDPQNITQLMPDHKCDRLFRNAELPLQSYCYVDRPPETPITHTNIVIGDSHAGRIVIGLVTTDPHSAIYGYITNGCMPISNFIRFKNNSTQSICNAQEFANGLQVVRQTILASETPTTIYLVGRYSLINGHGINTSNRNSTRYQAPNVTHIPTEAEVDAHFQAGLAQTLDTLTTLPHTRVVFVDQVPEMSFTPLNCMRASQLFNISGHCVISQQRVQAHFARYQRLVSTVLQTRPQVLRYQPMDILCTAGVCTALGDNQSLLYKDDHHLNDNGSILVTRHMLARITDSP